MIYIIYIYIYGSVVSVTVIVVGNTVGIPSSNSRRSCFCFTWERC